MNKRVPYYRVSISIIILGIVSLIDYKLASPSVKFVDYKYNELYSFIKLLLLPLAIVVIWHSLAPFVQKYIAGLFTLRVVSVLIILFCLYQNAANLLFEEFCGEYVIKELYQDKSDSTKKIVVTQFDCGATDGSPLESIVLRERINYLLMKEQIIDTSTLDLSKWDKVEMETVN